MRDRAHVPLETMIFAAHASYAYGKDAEASSEDR